MQTVVTNKYFAHFANIFGKNPLQQVVMIDQSGQVALCGWSGQCGQLVRVVSLDDVHCAFGKYMVEMVYTIKLLRKAEMSHLRQTHYHTCM